MVGKMKVTVNNTFFHRLHSIKFIQALEKAKSMVNSQTEKTVRLTQTVTLRNEYPKELTSYKSPLYSKHFSFLIDSIKAVLFSFLNNVFFRQKKYENSLLSLFLPQLFQETESNKFPSSRNDKSVCLIFTKLLNAFFNSFSLITFFELTVIINCKFCSTCFLDLIPTLTFKSFFLFLSNSSKTY